MSLDGDHGPAQPRKRGSHPGVVRGSYKPQRIKLREPRTPEELAALKQRCREYWGDLYDQNVRVYARELGRLVSVRSYLPPNERPPEPSTHDGEITSKVCRGCGMDWALSYFSPSRGGRGGVKSRCKSCCAESAREYTNTMQGKAARARTQAKFRAHLAAEQKRLKSKAAFVAVASKTKAGRALLEAAGMTDEASQMKDGKC